MDVKVPRDWDPHCPKCQEELKRMLELAQSVYEDLDHGAALYRLPLPPCTHRAAPDERAGEGGVG